MFMISLRNLKQSVIAFIDIALNRDVRKIFRHALAQLESCLFSDLNLETF